MVETIEPLGPLFEEIRHAIIFIKQLTSESVNMLSFGSYFGRKECLFAENRGSSYMNTAAPLRGKDVLLRFGCVMTNSEILKLLLLYESVLISVYHLSFT